MLRPSRFRSVVSTGNESQLCAVVLTSTGVAILRPQPWVTDRLGVRTRRWIPSVGAMALGLIGPQFVVLIGGLLSLPPKEWSQAATNILFLSSLAYLIAPLLGSLAAGGFVLMLYFG